MALSTLILKDEAYIKLAGLQINLTENASASDILNALGISKALFFKGITSTTLADNATTSPIVISGANYTPEAGAVVIYDDSEFLWTGSKWERLGRDSSFKLTQSPVSSPSASGAALAFIDTISQNENGNITVTKKNLDTVPVAQGGSGKTTAVDAANVFLSALPAWTANPTDTTYFVRQDTGGSNSFGRVKAETIYNYVAGKASGTWSISVAGNAATATKLATARSLTTKLDSTTAVTFDGSADQDAIPVTGTLPIANGGTGGTTAETARLNLGIGNSRVFYGICTTAAGTAAKVVTCAEYDQLKVGDMVIVKFDATNTAAVGSLTLSVNGSTAKNIKKLYNATGASNLVAAGELNKDGIAVFVYNGTYWLLTNADYNSTYYYTSIYCTTAAATAAKVAAISGAQELTAGKYFQVWMLYSNTAQSALTLNISSQGAKPIYINGTASSSTNCTLPRGCYIVYYDGTNYHFRTDNRLPGLIGAADTWTTGRTFTIGGTGKTVNGSTDMSWTLTEIGASVITNFTDGTSSTAPKISITVNGVTGNEITLTKASTSVYGVTKLTSSYDATSPDTTLAINGAGVQAAIQTLDVAEVGASSTASDTSDGKYIAKIKEEDGKITATVFTTSVGNTVTAGTGDNAPKISTTVNGIIGNSVELTKASTSVYGATKLTDTYSSSNSTLATTGKALLAALQTLDSTLPTGSAASKTLTALSMVDGKMSTATFTDIAIAASQVTSGTLPIAHGGTGASTAASALTNLGALANTNTGAADRPIYIASNAPTQTTYRMAGTNVTATTALPITDNLNTGIWYVNGTNSTDLYSQSDGVAYVEKYSDSWIHEIYGDYRTGQIAVRGKNNGTWQAWRKILDSTNYTNYTVKKDGTGATGTWGISITGNAATATIANGLVDGTSTMTSAYNKAGLAYADYTWLAGWNGYELRAVNKSQFATASHTHDRIVQAAITIQTGSAALAHINLATLMSWLITTKGYIPSGVQCHKYIPVSWSYAGNDILQFSAYGTNWEIQLAGCIMEFWGTATSSTGAGPFRLVIHTSPTQSYTSASGYQKVPVSSTWEYVCNGSGYSPTWVCLSHPYIIQVNPTNTPTAVGSIWVTT